MAIDVPTAQLLGTFLEMLGYGIYLVVTPQAFLVLRQKQLSRKLMIYLYSTMAVTFILVTMHLLIDLIRVFQAFTTQSGTPNAPETFFANVNTNLNFMKNSTVVATTLVADALLIYRTLIVWERRWCTLILPIVLYCLDVAMSIWFTWSVTEAKRGYSVLSAMTFSRSKYFFAATLAVNLVCTCLIAYRIWAIQNAVTRYSRGSHRVQNALLIILESAAIYTVALVVMIVLACLDSAVLFFFLNSMPSLIGSVFTFVILRSSSGGNQYSSDARTSLVLQGNVPQLTTTSERVDMKRKGSSIEGVQVHLERIVHHDPENEQESFMTKEHPA
ncbi:hypothetical protein AX15_007897 [Amanita polypyramis BW_CC]|nr:hypothetical protein AX15_007897 [Amanita polypyramis BW_CC]